ncbi:hypothetical protein DCAR_0519166 [Daucus carota subsp. sativus]|uniref:Uncharacterized protein n=1 Tax=Daucus carota subsp. sativus TaxID=79200 RepID=A0A164XRT7_DAUCS|nr:PREDICTED: protein ODORANT1-like [Daucus carota subsp. sativus]WOG99810.1 hypothetical protein DCAR_0519166 [Daucus carota subsp. sativus]
MGRRPCCDKVGLNKGPWTAEEDKKLVDFVLANHPQCCWREVPKNAGLLRCGKSCRLRWTNYLRPDLKRGLLSEYEEKLIIDLHAQLGNRWSRIASHMPGRTDNEIKNLWHTYIKKKLSKMGIDPVTHKPILAGPPNGNYQDHDALSQKEAQKSREEMQEQDKGQENCDGISSLEESIISNTDDYRLDKEQVAMDTSNGFSVPEVPWSIPHEFCVSSSDQQSSCSSTTFSDTSAVTLSMSDINSILEDLRFLPSFEDWQSDDNSKNYVEPMGVPYDDDFADWDWLINDFDIDNIDHEIVQSLPDPATA